MKLAMIVIAAGLTSTARADHTSFMLADLEVFDGFNWVHEVTVTPGQPVDLRLKVSFDLAAGNAVSFAEARFGRIDVSSAVAGDSASMFASALSNPPTATYGLVYPGPLDGRIVRTDGSNPDLRFTQSAYDQGGVLDNPIAVFQFRLTPDAGTSSYRTLNLTCDQIGLFKNAAVFTSTSGSSALIAARDRHFQGSAIHVPATGALGLLGATAFQCARRRRTR